VDPHLAGILVLTRGSHDDVRCSIAVDVATTCQRLAEPGSRRRPEDRTERNTGGAVHKTDLPLSIVVRWRPDGHVIDAISRQVADVGHRAPHGVSWVAVDLPQRRSGGAGVTPHAAPSVPTRSADHVVLMKVAVDVADGRDGRPHLI